ncbi:hypothetical protein HFO55_22795 [Rhizobium leguminosarum]|uniref:hypothetical protein n=1 Tax=Rhizobium leguminosarum TaxID=384 RepID=UPI001C94ED5D|nr:hypothetical protein [Rhizobium leguminosarum]MBY5570047.1 hypothetical protein [Rhizobium leguminosarum]MBY5576848.1 hypothetical protein [Rhizobium leguminosarum]
MKAPMQYPEPQSFVDALAQPFDSEVGSRVVEPFKIVWGDAVALDRGLDIYHVIALPLGIHLTFKHEGVVFDHAYQDDGKGPFLLTNCAFWGNGDGYESYKGLIWKDLTFSDTPASAEGKLGAPAKVGRYDIHSWILPDFKLTMQWKNPNSVRVISYWMKQ